MAGRLSPLLHSAYLRTGYRATTPQGELVIRIGHACPELDRLLVTLGENCWAFISACNPGSELLPAAENAARHERLVETLAEEGLRFFLGCGEADASDWPAEASVLVPGLSRTRGCALGLAFGQNAIVWGEKGSPAQLVHCQEEPIDPASCLRGI
jgi:hypothetical protein